MSDLQINTEVATFSINENTTSLSIIDSELIELKVDSAGTEVVGSINHTDATSVNGLVTVVSG